MSAGTPRRLGRGLEALITTARQQRETIIETISADESLIKVAISDVLPNPYQPRKTFREDEIAELAFSLKNNGLLQPITVRKAGSGWELVAGERRLRAATSLGWSLIPAYVRDFDQRAMLTLALVENLQRSDLNALEEAEGYQRLIDEFGLTQQQVAEAVGKDRTTVTGLLRVLQLPSAIRTMVEQRHLSTGHARALLAVKNARQQLELANEIVARQLSVRDVESRARTISDCKTSAPPRPRAGEPKKSVAADPMVRRIEDELRRALQTEVSVVAGAKTAGHLRVAFYSADDLERLRELIAGKARSDFD